MYRTYHRSITLDIGVLYFFNCPHINLPCQESYRHHSNTCPTINFNVFQIDSRCVVYGRHPLDKNDLFCLCLRDPDSMTPSKLYLRKEFIMIEKSIADLHTSFYIPLIQQLLFHLPHVSILGTDHWGKSLHEAFKCRR